MNHQQQNNSLNSTLFPGATNTTTQASVTLTPRKAEHKPNQQDSSVQSYSSKNSIKLARRLNKKNFAVIQEDSSMFRENVSRNPKE
jgi:hypothetical protein